MRFISVTKFIIKYRVYFQISWKITFLIIYVNDERVSGGGSTKVLHTTYQNVTQIFMIFPLSWYIRNISAYFFFRSAQNHIFTQIFMGLKTLQNIVISTFIVRLTIAFYRWKIKGSYGDVRKWKKVLFLINIWYCIYSFLFN